MDTGAKISTQKNVLGQPLEICGKEPLTGFFRDGCCNTGPDDQGQHTVCCLLTEEFLATSAELGNDLFAHGRGVGPALIRQRAGPAGTDNAPDDAADDPFSPDHDDLAAFLNPACLRAAG